MNCGCLSLFLRQTHFLRDLVVEGVFEFIKEDGFFFFAVGDVGEFVVGFAEIGLKDVFPGGDEFGVIESSGDLPQLIQGFVIINHTFSLTEKKVNPCPGIVLLITIQFPVFSAG